MQEIWIAAILAVYIKVSGMEVFEEEHRQRCMIELIPFQATEKES